MAFIDKYAVGVDPEFRARCEVAACLSAANVAAESSATTGHDLRLAYATKVLNAPATASGPIAMAVAAQPGITGLEANDGDIEFTINSLWNAFSGVSTN